jgi:hypothetical protein
MKAKDRWRKRFTFTLKAKRMLDGSGAFIDRQ